MEYGLTIFWLAVLVIFLGIAALWHLFAWTGYGLLVLGVVGMLRASAHMREAFRLGRMEDEERQKRWEEWGRSVGVPSEK